MTERDSNTAVMTVKGRTQAQIKDGFTLLLAALVMLEAAAHTYIVIQILADTSCSIQTLTEGMFLAL